MIGSQDSESLRDTRYKSVEQESCRFCKCIALCRPSFKRDKLPETFGEGNMGYGDRDSWRYDNCRGNEEKSGHRKVIKGGVISYSTKLGVDCWFL